MPVQVRPPAPWVLTALVLLALLALTACRHAPDPSAATPPDAAQPFGPDRLAAAKAACTAEGGRWGTGAVAGTFTCFRPAPDAYAPCDSGDDCSVLCLARARACAPFSPFPGCHEVLTASGARATVCIE